MKVKTILTYVLVLVIGVIFGAVLPESFKVYAASTAHPDSRMAQTKTGMEPIKFEIYPRGAVKENPVTVCINGYMYKDSWWFDQVKAGMFTPSADERFMMKVVDVNTNGTPDDQLTLWPQDERQDTYMSVSDPIFFAGNQGYYKRIPYSAFLAKIAYGPYTIFFIQHSGPEEKDEIYTYPVVNISGTYYCTNKMKSDPIFLYLTEQVKEYLTLKARPAQ
ncbi:hypothetical protein GMSM_46720 [Geomonas sp. Red276]